MGKQTSVQESNTIRFGSGKFEVKPYTNGTYVDLGAMRDVQFDENWDRVRVESHNAGTITQRVRNHTAALQGNLMEINLENLQMIRGNLDTYELHPEDGEEDAHRTFESGHNFTIDPVAVRLTNVDEDNNEFVIEVFKATVEDGITLELPSDEDEDPGMIEIRLEGEVDTSEATNKLFKITDYQHDAE